MMLNDVKFGWRLWRGQRVLWLILIFGLSAISALFSLSLQLKDDLSNRDKDWLYSGVEYVTLAALQDTGEIAPIQGEPIKAIVASEEVLASTKLLFKKVIINIGGINKEVDILFYDDSFFDVFNFSNAVKGGKHSYISSALMDQHSGANIYIRGQNLGSVIPLADTQSSLSGLPIDLLVPMHFYDVFNPFLTSASEKEREELRFKFPIFYGVAIVKANSDTSNILYNLHELVNQSKASSSVTIKSEVNTWVKKGVVLEPIKSKFINEQLVAMLALFWCCLAIYLINYFNFTEVRCISRARELNIRRSLGANENQLYKALFKEQISFVIPASFFAILLSVIVYKGFVNSSFVTENFSITLSFDWILAVLAFCSILGVLVFVYLKPVYYSSKSQQLSNTKYRSLNKQQQLKSQIISLIQYTAALVALIYTSTLITQQIISVDTKNLDTEIIGFEFNNPKSEDLSSLLNLSDKELSVSFPSLFSPSNAGLSWGIEGKGSNKQDVRVVFISKHLPKVLLDSEEQNHGFGSNEILINQSMAKLVKAKSGSTLGTTLKVSMLFTELTVKVVGVIDDLPHQGIGKANVPYVYLSMEALAAFPIPVTSPVFYCKKESLSHCQNKLFTGFNKETTQANILAQTTIKEQLSKMNPGGDLIIVMSLMSYVLVIFLLITGLYFHVKQNITNNKTTIGVRLAVGARERYIYKDHCLKNLCVLSLATLIALAIVELFLTDLIHSMNWLSFVSSVSCLLILSSGVLLFVLKTTLKSPIQELLSG